MCNEEMRYFAIVFILLLFSNFAIAQDIDQILNTSPIESAEKALASGDASFMIVPMCFEGIPGWADNKPPKNEKYPWKTCEELFGSEQYDKLQKLEKWAKKYNQHLSKKLNQ